MTATTETERRKFILGICVLVGTAPLSCFTSIDLNEKIKYKQPATTTKNVKSRWIEFQ